MIERVHYLPAASYYADINSWRNILNMLFSKPAGMNPGFMVLICPTLS